MALPVNRPSNEVVLSTTYADLSTAGSAFVAATHKGYVTRVYSIIQNAITSANSTWTVEINGTATGGTVTVTQSGSAAGDVDSYEIGYSSTNYVNEGDTIEFVCAGESSTTCITTFHAVIEAH